MQASPDAPSFTLKSGQTATPVEEEVLIKYNNDPMYNLPGNVHLNQMTKLGACPGLFHVNAHISPDQLTCVHRFFRVQHGVVL